MKTASTPYYIDYVINKENGCFDTYYQLVRTKDDAILYASEELDNIFLNCWHRGISKDDVVIL